MRKSIFAEERTSILPSQATKLAGAREGLYENEDGKNIDYKDRLAEQQELKNFCDALFGTKASMSFDEYVAFNQKVSSELFVSLMAIFDERLPCANNFFRLKRLYRSKITTTVNRAGSMSPSRAIASPTMLKGIGAGLNSGLIKKDNDPRTPTLFGKKAQLGGGKSTFSKASD
jgi:hypothetical protein